MKPSGTSPSIAIDGALEEMARARPLHPEKAWVQDRVRDALGLDRLPPAKVLRIAEVAEALTGTLARHQSFQIVLEDGLIIPFTVSQPLADRRSVLLICLQGHATDAATSLLPELPEGPPRNYAWQALERGFSTLVMDHRGFGDRREERRDVSGGRRCLDPAMRAIHGGWTLMGERLSDVQRLLDWICEEAGLSQMTVGLIGESTGGTLGTYLALLDDRIELLVDVCGFCSYEGGILSIPHCTDNFLPGILRHLEFGTIAGAIAPTPQIIQSSIDDTFYPKADVEAAFADVADGYQRAGYADRTCLLMGPGNHAFAPDLVWPEVDRMLERLGA